MVAVAVAEGLLVNVTVTEYVPGLAGAINVAVAPEGVIVPALAVKLTCGFELPATVAVKI